MFHMPNSTARVTGSRLLSEKVYDEDEEEEECMMMMKKRKNEEWAPVDQYDDDQRYFNW